MSPTFPPWLRRPWASGKTFGLTKAIVEEFALHTVCQSARCPNLGECWGRGTATVMVLGNLCTRNCAFCVVPSGVPFAVDAGEPRRVAEAVGRMALKHAVVTTVVRDDLRDGGAAHIAETIRAIHELSPSTTVEVLVSDFSGRRKELATVLGAEPEVFGHNLETVRRLHGGIRDHRFTYEGSLEVLRQARGLSDRVVVKSAFMVGMGETPSEVRGALADLREASCEAVCIGQYLQPSARQREVAEFVPPEQFATYEAMALEAGFEFVVAGPFVRSSYRAEMVLEAPFARGRFSRRRAHAPSAL